MNMVSLLVWLFVQIFIFGMSIWFVWYGIRNWGERNLLTFIVLIFAVLGIWGVIESIWSTGLFN